MDGERAFASAEMQLLFPEATSGRVSGARDCSVNPQKSSRLIVLQ